jgi:hypothetical protein
LAQSLRTAKNQDEIIEIIATYVAFRNDNPEHSDKLPDFSNINIDFDTAISTEFKYEEIREQGPKKYLEALFIALGESMGDNLKLSDITITPEKLGLLVSGLDGSEVTELSLWRTNISNEEEVDRLADGLVGSKITKVKGVIATPRLEEVLAANAAPAARMAGASGNQATAVDEYESKENGREPASTTESGGNADTSGSEEQGNCMKFFEV